MAYIPRSGLFGFLLLLAALAPAAGMAASSAAQALPDSPAISSGQVEPVAADSIEGRLRRISAALRTRDAIDPAAPRAAASTDGKLAWVFANGPRVGFRNAGGWGNGGGFRNGGFLNRW